MTHLASFLLAAGLGAHEGLAFVSREIKASLNDVKLQVLLSPAIHKLSWIIWLPFSENTEKKGTRGNCGVIYHNSVTQDFILI